MSVQRLVLRERPLRPYEVASPVHVSAVLIDAAVNVSRSTKVKTMEHTREHTFESKLSKMGDTLEI